MLFLDDSPIPEGCYFTKINHNTNRYNITMRKFVNLLILSSIFIYYGCGEDSPTSPPIGDSYVKIITAENGSIRFEIWSATSDMLQTGYNKIGFKVFENGTSKNTGFVKFNAKMYHSGTTNTHGTPAQESYGYNTSLGLFDGYLIMLMPGDSTSTWYGFYNYNNDLHIDSVQFDVKLNDKAKFKIFVDLNTGLSYLITVLDPLLPRKDLNTFQCMLHESFDFIYFTQANNAQMYIRPWLDSLNHSSSNNINPVDPGTGIYEGKVNFDYSGLWQVYDSIYYDNKWITQSGGTPYIVFNVP